MTMKINDLVSVSEVPSGVLKGAYFTLNIMIMFCVFLLHISFMPWAKCHKSSIGKDLLMKRKVNFFPLGQKHSVV